MQIQTFEDIAVWKKSRELTILLYTYLRLCKDYSYKDQAQRAAVSIMNNIAEGFERKGNKEFVKFLYISKGSCAEVRSLLHLGKDLEYFDKKQYDLLCGYSIEISKMLSGFIKVLE